MAHEIGGESQAATGSGDAEAGCKDRRGVVEIVDSKIRNDQVNRVVGQCQTGGIGNHQLDVGQPQMIKLAPQSLHGASPRVDRDDTAARPTALRQFNT